jgi:hypothetical protein
MVPPESNRLKIESCTQEKANGNRQYPDHFARLFLWSVTEKSKPLKIEKMPQPISIASTPFSHAAPESGNISRKTTAKNQAQLSLLTTSSSAALRSSYPPRACLPAINSATALPILARRNIARAGSARRHFYVPGSQTHAQAAGTSVLSRCHCARFCRHSLQSFVIAVRKTGGDPR